MSDQRLQFAAQNGLAVNLRIEGKAYDLCVTDMTDRTAKVDLCVNGDTWFPKIGLTVEAADFLNERFAIEQDWRFDLLVLRLKDPSDLSSIVADVDDERGQS
mgnify:CR=1 FL=1